MRLVLFQPDIAPNAGSLLRLGACLGVPVDIVEPCGFVFSAAQMRRAGMDYLALPSTSATPPGARSWRSMAKAGSCS
jgi:tRNA (cytidine/uridine-2'-O-)-methyltransferase